jgi:hypothetical protein
MTELEAAIFAFLERKYVQCSNPRQKAMGLQYMEAETHDLAEEIARFVSAAGRSFPSTQVDNHVNPPRRSG